MSLSGRLGFPGALPQRRVVWMWFGAFPGAFGLGYKLIPLASLCTMEASLVAQTVKNLPAMQETWV